MRRPNPVERVLITTEASKGSDAALAARDRRSRARISPRTNIAMGTTVYVGKGEHEHEVLGPGRGEGWALLAYVDDESNPCFGTFHESQISATPPGEGT